MSNVLKKLVAIGFAASLAMGTASVAYAKAHDQGSTDSPGQNVGAETAGPAQGLGGAVGNGNGPAGTPAGEAPGNSGDAGAPGGAGNSGE